jgi:hypothetical protein
MVVDHSLVSWERNSYSAACCYPRWRACLADVIGWQINENQHHEAEKRNEQLCQDGRFHRSFCFTTPTSAR